MDQELVRKYFDYDAESGELTWKLTKGNRATVGSSAGCQEGRGYSVVKVDRRIYYAHRLIWLWVYGYFPEHVIDHINRNPSDNRLDNLREVTPQCNLRNAKQSRNNTSGVTGVRWDKAARKWKAYIKVNNRDRHLGRHQDFTEAVSHRLAAEQCLNWEGCDSSSDAFKYLQETRHG